MPNRGFQLPPCPAVLSVSALRAGALALAPTCTRPRAGRRAGPAWRPVRPLSLSCGGQGPAFFAESAGKRLLPWEGGKRAAEGARSKEEAEEGEGSRVRCRHSGEGGSEPDKKPLGRPAARPPGRPAARTPRSAFAAQRPSSSAMLCHRGARKCTGRHPAASEARTARSVRQGAERRREKEAAFCCCPLGFLCLLLSDDKQKLAFINAVYLKKETEKGGGAAAAGERRRQGSSSKGSICADTQTGKQQQQQMQQQQ